MRVTFFMLAMVCLAGCQTPTPWANRNEPPPVELLDDTPVGATMPRTVPMEEPGLRLSASQRFSDIPLPADVREDLDRTYVFESKTLQIGRMVYTTRASINELSQFYAREMPTADWRLETTLQVGGGTVLRFIKPRKRAEVSITPQGVGRSNLLIINLTPTDDAVAGY